MLIWYLRDVSTSTEWSLAGALAVCCAAEVLHVDYGAFGVALIGVYYILRELPVLQAGAGAILSAWEMPAPLGSLLLLFYNGERADSPNVFLLVLSGSSVPLLCDWNMGASGMDMMR